MTADVYFYDIHDHNKVSPIDKLEELFYKAGTSQRLFPEEFCAVKVHFGEPGNTTFVRPVFVKRLVRLIRDKQAKPFLTDTNTLYYGSRADAVEHLEAAIGNGFAYAVVGAPLIIADGLNGKDFVNVAIDGEHFNETKIGSAIYHADSMIVVSHFKGHELTGFGGAIKNLGMGCASRSGKQMMHSSVKPTVTSNECTTCSKCLQYCPRGAISIVEEHGHRHARINGEKCYGCGECVVTCRSRAIHINWHTETSVLQEKMAEFALGAVSRKRHKTVYFNFLLAMSPCCDCYGFNDAPVHQDIGILASTDPVAIDKASLDLVGERVFNTIYPDIDSLVQVRHAEKVGLGTMDYRLVTV